MNDEKIDWTWIMSLLTKTLLSKERLGAHRWYAGRTFSWRHRFRRFAFSYVYRFLNSFEVTYLLLCLFSSNLLCFLGFKMIG